MDTINTRLLKQLIRVLERMERRGATCPLQQREHSVGSNEASNPNSKEKPLPVITVRAITEPGDAQVRENKTDRYSTNAFQKESLVVQWCLCFVTLCAFGAALYYAMIAADQRDIMSKTLNSQERAYLASGVPHQFVPGRNGTIYVPISNYGHVSSINPTFKFTHERLSGPQIVDTQHYTVKSDSVIAPGPAGFEMTIVPPRLSSSDEQAVSDGKQMELLETLVRYDTGFGYTDGLEFCIVYSRTRQRWDDCGHRNANIDLTKQKPQ